MPHACRSLDFPCRVRNAHTRGCTTQNRTRLVHAEPEPRDRGPFRVGVDTLAVGGGRLGVLLLLVDLGRALAEPVRRDAAPLVTRRREVVAERGEHLLGALLLGWRGDGTFFSPAAH